MTITSDLVFAYYYFMQRECVSSVESMLYSREFSRARNHFASAHAAEKQENHCSLAQTWPIYTCFISTNQRKEQIMDVDLPRTANILSTLGVCGVSLLLDDPWTKYIIDFVNIRMYNRKNRN